MKCLKMWAAATDVEQSCLLPDHLKPKALSRGINGSEFQLTVTFHIQRRKKKAGSEGPADQNNVWYMPQYVNCCFVRGWSQYHLHTPATQPPCPVQQHRWILRLSFRRTVPFISSSPGISTGCAPGKAGNWMRFYLTLAAIASCCLTEGNAARTLPAC